MNLLSTPSEKDFNAENQLLLTCARTALDSRHIKRIHTLIEQNLDWSYLVDVAWKHGIGPLFFRSLKLTYSTDISTEALDDLGELYRENWVKNHSLAHELLKITKAFQSYGVRFLPLKGPVLAVTAYGDLALRQFSDLDLLVSRREFQGAREVLASLGYQPADDSSGWEGAKPRQADFQAFTRVRQTVSARVDLQWGMVGSHLSVNIDQPRWWERCQEVSLLGTSVPSLPAEELLLVLCVHGAKHEWERLAWICDVAELVHARDGQMNWDYVLEEGRRLGVLGMLWSGLSLANQLLSHPLPQEVTKLESQLKPLAQDTLALVRDRVFGTRIVDSESAEILVWHLSLRERWQDRIRYYFYLVRSRALSKQDWTRLPHPVLFAIFHYTLQPLRLIGKYGLASRRVKIALSRWFDRIG